MIRAGPDHRGSEEATRQSGLLWHARISRSRGELEGGSCCWVKVLALQLVCVDSARSNGSQHSQR